MFTWEQTWPCASRRKHFSLMFRESIKVEIFMKSNPTKWKAWSLVTLVVTAPVKCYGGRCQLSCVLAPARHWRCFTVGLIGLLPCLHPCWLSVIKTSASFDQPPSSLTTSPFPFVLHLPLNYIVERAWSEGETIDCFAALCLLHPFSCSPDSAELAVVKRVTADRTCRIKGSWWMACWLLVQLKSTLCCSLSCQKVCFIVTSLLKWPV